MTMFRSDSRLAVAPKGHGRRDIHRERPFGAAAKLVVAPKWVLMAVVGVLVAAFVAATHARHAPTTAPDSSTIKLADAQPLGDLQDPDMVVNLTDKLAAPQTNDTVYFGEIDQYANENDDTPVAAVPVIAVHPGDAWKAVPLAGQGLTNAGWKYVGAGPRPKEVWGVLDTSAGESRSNFAVVHSTDGGTSFVNRVFHKPCKLATVSDFAMTRDGHGRVTVSLDTVCGKNQPGLYNFDTTDGGKTWSDEPRFEPDAMIRAEQVPDDEQPEPKTGASRTSLHSIRSASMAHAKGHV